MTEQGLPRSCPEAAVLAAFAEGSLAGTERRAVERHVAMCLECPAVVGATVHYLEEEQEDEPDSWRLDSRRFVAAAVVTVCLATTVWYSVGMRDPMRRVRAIASTQPTRSIEGHLHQFPHARFADPRNAETLAAAARLRAEAERLRKRSDPAGLHARGVAALLSGRAAEATGLLKAAARATPDDAALLSDIAAAELARASLGDRDAAASALRAADRALILSPSLASAHFNRAVALQYLDRRDEAIGEFRKALDGERSAPWRDEIRARLEILTRDR